MGIILPYDDDDGNDDGDGDGDDSDGDDSDGDSNIVVVVVVVLSNLQVCSVDVRLEVFFVLVFPEIRRFHLKGWWYDSQVISYNIYHLIYDSQVIFYHIHLIVLPTIKRFKPRFCAS